MVPRSRGSMRFKAARVPYTTPRYVTSVTRLYSSAFISFTGENTEAIALFTHISIGPNSCSTDAAAFSIALASATSRGSTDRTSASRFDFPLGGFESIDSAGDQTDFCTMSSKFARRSPAQAGRRPRYHDDFVLQFTTIPSRAAFKTR